MERERKQVEVKEYKEMRKLFLLIQLAFPFSRKSKATTTAKEM
jgi:hypothetical protein